MPFIPKRIWFYAFSLALAGLAVIFLALFGLKAGSDFQGGAIWEVRLSGISLQEFKKAAQSHPLTLEVQQTPTGFILKGKEIHKETLKKAVEEQFKKSLEEVRFEEVGSLIGGELRRKAYLAVVLVLAAIALYVASAFHGKVSGGFFGRTHSLSSIWYGIVTLIALAHDLLITSGFVAVLGRVSGYEADVNFIVALLVVAGFSVHDTIVVFDRVRENLKHQRGPFAQIVNTSINETLVRSIATSLTTVIAIAGLTYTLPVLRPFLTTLIFGITVGTYSSIFVASPLLVDADRVLANRRR